MFNNWINIIEPIRLFQRLRRDSILRQRILTKFHFTNEDRIISSWSHTNGPAIYWLDIPQVRKRVNAMITGSPNTTYHHDIAQRYLQNGGMVKALSLGCGTGKKELQWAETGCFQSIDAYDISEKRIRMAREELKGTRFQNIIKYHVGNIEDIIYPDAKYDIVIFDHSLHHFSSIDSLLQHVHNALKPNGFLIANEFVGPSRFQWTKIQIDVANGLLSIFPSRYKTRWDSNMCREKLWRPSKLAMWISDPSEAIESSKIVPLIHKHFKVIEQKGYGGSILHLVFSGIAHHFINPDDIAQKLLDIAFAVEDILLHEKEIDHDFAFIVAKKS